MADSILIIDDEPGMCKSLSELLEASGFHTMFSTDPEKTVLILKSHPIDLLIMDVRMPKKGGIALLRTVKEMYHDLPVIMITGYPSIGSAVTAMRYGAQNFYTKPIAIDEMVREIRTVLTIRETRGSLKKDSPPPSLASHNSEMADIINIVERVASTKASVIITGESGTGKELIAYNLHEKSERRDKPFVKVNCAAIPDSLLESELFGHEKGAFTDAKSLHRGKFEMANGGSIFLDEIGDMNLKTQAKILRILQEQEFQRIGGNSNIKTDIRFIAATNKDISKLIKEGLFREDLYYRLSVICIQLPSLRDRREDIADLTHYFIRHFNAIYNKKIEGFSSEVEAILSIHDWPGNIRELKNCIERAIIFCDGEEIAADDLPKQYSNLRNVYFRGSYTESRNEHERDLIIEALQKADGVKNKAADILQIHRKTLYNKMKKLGME